MLQHHNAKDRAVRFRVCQLVTKLLGNLGDEATIEDALYERVFHCMLERLRDKAAMVRVHAVLALVRLQDPTDDTCPVIKGESLNLNNATGNTCPVLRGDCTPVPVIKGESWECTA